MSTMKTRLTVLLITLAFTVKAQQKTYDTTFAGWNARVTYDPSKKDSSECIIFFPGAGEVGTDVTKLRIYGPHYWLLNGWDGSVQLGNGVHYPILISLQPPNQAQLPPAVKIRIDAILGRYKIKRNALHFTGPSAGGWYSSTFVSYMPAAGDYTYGRMVKSVCVPESVKPGNIFAATPAYPLNMVSYAKLGGKLWGFDQIADGGRDMQTYCKAMNDAVPGSATRIVTDFGNGSHCCFENFWNPAQTNWTASNPNVVSLGTGTYKTMNVYQWMLRNGDTSLTQTVTVSNPAPPASQSGSTETAKYIKVNLYGGTNPYNNSEWNNWNVVTASGSNASVNISSGTFKYSDGSSSGVTALLSHSQAVKDNGAGYGSGMAPAEVLRYTSYSSMNRTLTLYGLSPSKQYNLELYASRSSSGNPTEFKTGSAAQTIDTYNNLINKALFSNISPNTLGQLVIYIDKISSFDYLNGFTIIENPDNTTTTASTSVSTSAISNVDRQTEDESDEKAAALKILPNPVYDKFIIQLNNDLRGPMTVQIIDLTGHTQAEYLSAKNQDAVSGTYYLNSRLSKGVYIVRIRIGQWETIKKIIKL